MNETVTNAIASTKNFINKHKFAIGVTAGLTAGLALNKRNMNQVDEFLKEHGLYETYWAAEEI
jgi:hypothetical protein